MRRLILHVGPHKTGSTSIQMALFFASKQLFNLGIYYPTEWISSGHQSHHALFEQLRGKQFDIVKNTAAHVLGANANTIVISAEDLSLLSVEELNILMQAFRSVEPNLDFSIVFYVRRWSDLIPSVVQELIKHGVSLTLADIVAQELSSPEPSDIVNYVNRLDRFATVFGADSIQIVSFDNLADSKQSLVDHFFRNVLSCAWKKSEAYDIDAQHNRSLSIIEVEFLRAHHGLVKAGSIQTFPGDANEYLMKLRASNYQELAVAMRGHVRGLTIDEAALPFSAFYDLLNTKYRRRFLNPAASGTEEQLFQRVRRTIEYIHPNYLCDIRVLSSMIALNQKISVHPA